jgi:hypothetical protein
MIFLILMGILILVVAFFHFLQGLFSATLSAIFTVIAAVLAFSYHETIVEGLLGGKVADEAHALVLLALFGIIYLVLRTAFDSLVPGNVRVPSGVDKGGAAVMGVIAGVFAAGFARYDLQEDRPVVAPTAGRALDRTEYNELTYHQPGKFGDDPHGHGVAILPVDNILVGTVQKLSDGALSAGKQLNTVHPDFLDELFGQRMGIETGGNHVAMNLPDKKLEAADVVGLYTRSIPATQKAQGDAESPKLRTGGALKPVTPLPSETFLVVRITFKLQAADQKDRIFRFSPGSARLVVNIAPPGSDPEFTNFYPIGTLQDAKTLYLNKVDDFLFVPVGEGDRGVDLVFKVNKKQFENKAPPGTFIEVKRLARVDLSGMEIKPGPKPSPDYNPLRKVYILAPPVPTPAPEAAPETPPTPTPPPTPEPQPTPPPTPAPPPVAKTFQVKEAVASDALPVPITGPAGAEGSLVQVPGGTAVITQGKLKVGNLDSTQAEQTQPTKVTQFAIPAGQSMVQVSGAPSAAAPWGFANEPESYEVVDSAGKKYQPYGLFALYDVKEGERMTLRYIDASTISGSSPPENASKPKQIILFYLVPPNTSLTEFHDHGQKARDISVTSK